MSLFLWVSIEYSIAVGFAELISSSFTPITVLKPLGIWWHSSHHSESFPVRRSNAFVWRKFYRLPGLPYLRRLDNASTRVVSPPRYRNHINGVSQEPMTMMSSWVSVLFPERSTSPLEASWEIKGNFSWLSWPAVLLVRVRTTTTESRKMAAIVQLIGKLRNTALVYSNVMVDSHLSKQSFRWPVSRDHIAGSCLEP